MLTFEWNALGVGDHVVVHDDRDPGLTLHDGVVRIVEARRGVANDVRIRVDGAVRRVRRHAVHMLPLDRRDCWRCDAAGAGDLRRAA